MNEIELNFNVKEFIDIIKKMAIPVRNSKKGFECPVIFPKLIPCWKNGKFEKLIFQWIAIPESESINIWVTVELKDYVEFKEPIQIPIDVKNVLFVLDDFKNSGNITFTHNADAGFQTITDENTTIYMPINGEEPDENVFDSYPGNIDENEVIIFSSGDLKPTIQGTCDIEFLKNATSSINKYSSKKGNDIVYNFKVCGEQHVIACYSNKENIRKGNVFYRCYEDDSIVGSGELHYIYTVSSVVDILFGKIKFYARDCGVLLLMQDTEKIRVRYLIPPAEE
jgi:hypothetical protein